MNFTTLREAALQDTDTLVKFIMIVYMSLDDVNRDREDGDRIITDIEAVV